MWAFLLSAVVPLLYKALAALGIGVVTFTALTAITDQLTAVIQSNFYALPSDILAILTLGGVAQSLTIITTAFITRVSMQSLKKLDFIK